MIQVIYHSAHIHLVSVTYIHVEKCFEDVGKTKRPPLEGLI